MPNTLSINIKKTHTCAKRVLQTINNSIHEIMAMFVTQTDWFTSLYIFKGYALKTFSIRTRLT